MIIREKNKKKQFSYYLKCQILPVVIDFDILDILDWYWYLSGGTLWQAKTAVKALSSQFSSSFHCINLN